MKFRNILSLFVVGVLLVSCDSQGSSPNTTPSSDDNSTTTTVIENTNGEIALTAEEEAAAGNDSNIIAQLLVKKAILREIAQNPFTEEELNFLAIAKENLEVEAFLNKQAQETASRSIIPVTDEEVLAVFEANREQFGDDVDPLIVIPQLTQLMQNQRFNDSFNNIRINIVNEYIEKYKLNDILRKYVPESAITPQDIPSTPQVAPTTESEPVEINVDEAEVEDTEDANEADDN